MLHNGILSSYGQYIVKSVDFDGTNDYMKTGAGLTGASDSGLGTVSFWIRLDGGDTTFMTILHAATTVGGPASRFRVRRQDTNKLSIVGVNSANTTILDGSTLNSLVSGSNWHHIAISFDLSDTGKRHFIVDGIEDGSWFTYTNSTIDYTVADWTIGGQANGGTKFNGCIAEFYFTMGQYIDLSNATNLAKLRNNANKPVNLGVTGTAPGLGTPNIYCRVNSVGTASDFATNLGSGGNFTITGSLDLGSDSPSD